MFTKKMVHSLLVALALLVVLPLSACGFVNEGNPVPAPSNGDGAGGRAHVEDVELMMMESFPVQVRAVITGHLSDGCTSLEETQVTYDETTRTFRVEIQTSHDDEAVCTQALVPFEETVSLDVQGLSAGSYTVEVQDQTATFELAVDNVIPEE